MSWEGTIEVSHLVISIHSVNYEARFSTGAMRKENL